jgi:hypothetical protein
MHAILAAAYRVRATQKRSKPTVLQIEDARSEEEEEKVLQATEERIPVAPKMGSGEDGE